MGDKESLYQLQQEIKQIKERLYAIEKEQRMLREDILSGDPRERMHKRLLEKPSEKRKLKEKIDDDIRIEI